MCISRLVTIGLYGFTEQSFFTALLSASVDVLCDVRRRRGVRGSTYSFANSRRLQDRLREVGIGYVHMKDLAPTDEIRQLQWLADKEMRVGKRQRQVLSESFSRAYTEQCLVGLDARAFLQRLGPDCRVPALFCVERNPEACHRLLLAERLARDLGVEVEHLLP